MKRTLFVLAALALAGCSPSLSAANERGGLVSHATGLYRGEAFQLADNHCRQFGRAARISGQDVITNTMSFDCVQ